MRASTAPGSLSPVRWACGIAMAVFDNLYRALGSTTLRSYHGDLAEVAYTDPTGTVTPDLEVIARNDRWDVEQTNNGERRVRVKDFTIKSDALAAIHVRGMLTDSAGLVWNIRSVRSKSPTLIWVEAVNRTAFEETRPNLRVPQ